MIDAVDFPGFVADLVNGVFDAIVDASIRQMEAYGDLLESVAKTVDQFIDDTVTDEQARDYLLDTFPDVFAKAGTKGPAIKRRRKATKGRWRLALSLLGMPKADRKPDPDTLSKRLIQAARRHLVRQRQQLLATMVLMGIQRINRSPRTASSQVQAPPPLSPQIIGGRSRPNAPSASRRNPFIGPKEGQKCLPFAYLGAGFVYFRYASVAVNPLIPNETSPRQM